MDINQFVNKIKSYIADDDLRQAIEELKKFMESQNEFNEIIMQSARYNDIESQIRMNLVSKSEADVEKNKIRFAILQIADNLQQFSDKIFINQKVNDTKDKVNTILTDFLNNSLNDIKKRMTNLYEMLREYENEFTFESDPKTKMKYKKEINDLKTQIESAENELLNISKKL